jgi:L-cysteate sulfo-lyase
MLLARYPRVRLVHAPTPLEPMHKLGRHLGGPTLWVKRDDCTGLGGGGNKIRKLEFLLGDALAQGRDAVLTCGALQSNHARQTAAAAARMGLECHLFLEDRGIRVTPDYMKGGNVLLNTLFGARQHVFSRGTDLAAEMERHAATLRQQGRKPYVIPLGGTNPVGDLGYVECVLELTQQANLQGISIDQLVVGTGSGGTQAGLLAGLFAINSSIAVTGIAVSPKPDHVKLIHGVASATLAHLGVAAPLPRERVAIETDYLGAGYGQLTEGVVEAIELAAKLEGLLLDPVYTGKAMSGLIGMIRSGRFNRGGNLVFMHTGGLPGLFAYREDFVA